MASFALHVSQKAPRTGKAPLPGNISPPCIQNELTLARFARHVSEKPCKSPSEDASREYLARKEPFLLHRPLESCTTRESCHSWVFRLGVAGEARGEAGRGVPARRMRLAHAPPALCEAARCFRGLTSCSFELSPLTRTMLLLLRLLSRETCSLPPPARGAYVPRRPMRGKRIRFASLNWLALRMRVTPTAPLPRLCCGRSDGIGGGLPHRVAASTRLAACVQPLLARGFIAPSTLRPKRRDCVVCRRKHGAVMVFR